MSIQEEVNEVLDLVVYLQMIGSVIPGSNFSHIKEIITSTYDFIKKSNEQEIKAKLPELKAVLIKMTTPLMSSFPLKRELRNITTEFNEFFKAGNSVYYLGLEFGWLESQMDLTKLNFYKDTPYHYRIGIGPHRGNGSVEEDFLLKDAFSIRVKAEYYYNLLNDYGNKLKETEEKQGLNEFTQELYSQITDIKFEVSAYSRLTIISFYAFVEGFVNSVGHSFLSKNYTRLSETEKELLSGLRKGRFLQLKSKIEKFQSIIRTDKKVKVIVSDEGQISRDFKLFFEYYEQLRNSAMHYSPLKEKIWMKPQEWIDNAIEFSKLSTKVALEFWVACYPKSDGPEYLGKLNHDLHLKNAVERANRIENIDTERKNWL